MPIQPLEKYVGKSFRSIDPRDDDRRIRITDVDVDGDGARLLYRRLVPSSVSPKTLVPRGRHGSITPETLCKTYMETT